MAQTLFLPPTTTLPTHHVPSSPDPTPLRMLAFSVAEAALQSDPNSPHSRSYTDSDRVGPWSRVSGRHDAVPNTLEIKRTIGGIAAGMRLWDVVERAKERRVRDASPSRMTEPQSSSPPISPATYNFVLPPNSPLAASIASTPTQGTPRSSATLQTPPHLLPSPAKSRGLPLYTRSAEPSPTRSTFSLLDQTRPPPVFVPRLSANEFAKMPSTKPEHVSPSQRLLSQARRVPYRHVARLPSLAQIQAKMSKAGGHRRVSSVGSISVPHLARIATSRRDISDDSVEILQTPTDEQPPCRPRVVLSDSPDRRPQTPPSPTASAKEARLAPFLRQRVSGRLEAKARPVSMPPLRRVSNGPVLNVIPPTLETKATVPLPSPKRATLLSTPPNRSRPLSTSPTSPTSSISSLTSSSSPGISVPIITCTPAPARLVRDGVEQDSDEEGSDVVLFEGEGAEGDVDERERRGKEMLSRLSLRRRSG